MATELQRVVHWNRLAGNNRKFRTLDDPLVLAYIDYIYEEFDELKAGLLKGSRKEVLDALGDMLVVVGGAASAMGYCPESLLECINDSNFSKYCMTEEEAVMSVEGYNSMVRYKDVYYEQVGEYYIVRGYEAAAGEKVGKGKILKGVMYQDPELDDFMIEWDNTMPDPEVGLEMKGRNSAWIDPMLDNPNNQDSSDKLGKFLKLDEK